MNKILTMLLLFGVSPGTLLPSSITDQLIAPAFPQSEKTQDTGSKNNGEIPEPDEDSSPSTKHLSLGVPSIYSAIRPAGFHFTKGDFRTILTPRGFHTTYYDTHADAFSRSNSGLRPTAIMELDFCDTHRATVTSPEICAHAPPVHS